MGKKKTTKTKSTAEVKRAGIRFNPAEYYEIGATAGGESITLKADIDGTVTEYDVTGGGGGGGYEEVLLWENPEPSKGLKVDTLLTDDTIDLEEYEYFVIKYRNINNVEVLIDFRFSLDDILNNAFNFGLASTSDVQISDDYSARYIYVRQIWHDGNMGGIMASGECHELSAAFTNKNFRAVPNFLYGYKLK